MLENGACTDPLTHEKKDAAAWPDQNKICFSADRLAKRKYTVANALDRLAPLFLHEVSHFVGASEHETKQLQDQYFDFHIGNGLALDQQVILSYGHLHIIDIYLRMMQVSPIINVPELCLNIGGLNSEIFEAKQSFVKHFGYQITSPYTEAMSLSLYRLGQALDGFCLQSERSEYNERYPIPAQGFLDENGVMIPYVNFGDTISFQLAIENANTAVNQLLLELDKSPSKIKCKQNSNNDFACSPLKME